MADENAAACYHAVHDVDGFQDNPSLADARLIQGGLHFFGEELGDLSGAGVGVATCGLSLSGVSDGLTTRGLCQVSWRRLRR